MAIFDDMRNIDDNMAGDTGNLQDRYEELRAQEAEGTITEEGRQELDNIRQKLGM
jgi:hypothetical protein